MIVIRINMYLANKEQVKREGGASSEHKSVRDFKFYFDVVYSRCTFTIRQAHELEV